jgi:hypothetical protein
MAMTKLSPTDLQQFQAIFRALDEWFKSEMRKLYRTPDKGQGLLMGFPIWGQKYLDRMLKYFIASILAKENLAALRGRCRIVFFVPEDTDIPLYLSQRALKPLGLEPQIITIPQSVMEEEPKSVMNKYWILGTAQNLMIQMAGWSGMAFHMAQPDHIFNADPGAGYFANLFRLGEKHEAICQLGITAAEAGAAPEIDGWRQPDGSLAVPSRSLGDIGWRHLHKQMLPGIMNGPRHIPEGHPPTFWTGWQGREELHLYSCHMNPAWLSPRLCALAPTRIPATVDSELPAFIPGDFYVPTVEDGLTFIEISDDAKWDLPKHPTFEDFSLQCWSTIKFDDAYMPYFKRVSKFPIHPQGKWMTDEAIGIAHGELVANIWAERDRSALRFCRTLDASRLK